mmetsp:Transcript_56636/g.132906  ORF Transcript_56636/g.132906 Transcript_56636/m.132906 type:complete len:95 (+) Transcript_56636:90-374(+)
MAIPRGGNSSLNPHRPRLLLGRERDVAAEAGLLASRFPELGLLRVDPALRGRLDNARNFSAALAAAKVAGATLLPWMRTNACPAALLALSSASS